jgi:hypothetical protein
MRASPPQADRPPASSDSRVTGYERIDVSGRSALVRVSVALGRDHDPARAPDAQLVVRIDGKRERRHRPLPAPPAADPTELTLGFAVTRRAEALALELDGRSLSLPEPVVREPGAIGLAPAHVPTATPAAADADAEPDTLAQQLRTTRARLEEARAAAAVLEAERDGARQAAARAEAAAHDATARAEALARPVGALAADARRRHRRPHRSVVIAFAIGSAAVVGAILAAPAGNGGGDRGVATASPPAADAGVKVPAVFDALAQRLQIPAAYFTLYRETGARYGLDWTRLAAIGAIESRHGQSSETGVASGANQRGASGPAQFLAGTWERFGVDGDGDGTRDPHDPADAIAAMASYLRASGAPQDWRRALRTYNHSDAYATAVEEIAATYRRGAR